MAQKKIEEVWRWIDPENPNRWVGLWSDGDVLVRGKGPTVAQVFTAEEFDRMAFSYLEHRGYMVSPKE